MSSFRPGRFIGITAGALVILGLGVYGPATLLGPLPDVQMTTAKPTASAVPVSPPVLPAEGASAVVTSTGGSTDGTGAEAEPLAVSGVLEAVPMASVAKIIAALVVLHAKPLEVGRTGPAVVMTAEDFQGYLDYAAGDARTVTVFAGETWTERELLQAIILGSSNNHADTLARWAFGTVDAYVEAANAWLGEHGLSKTLVADATGLSDTSAGTATDLARLAGIAAHDPVITEILANPPTALAGRSGVDNTTEYLPEEGVRGISRSFTDAAGLCFLFAATVGEGESAFTFAGALLREPDYETLETDVVALMASARAGVGEVALLAEGDTYATFESAWGDTASGVVGVSKTHVAWRAAETSDPIIEIDPFTTGRKGTRVGTVSVEAGGERVSAPLELDSAISDPGPLWRLLNPVPVIGALIESG
ncbi:D-alanyl-D-alanine carboxypeptidase family protein [Glaciibacter superstes]|uniref:D-alanyl-D-alanine carboxypeptidase family protein n=1 Tax=Glaciibacter superstes TaxID=501023 RepID=UPI0003B376E8|nr:hypothetical protein [Glaciibacter superstes]